LSTEQDYQTASKHTMPARSVQRLSEEINAHTWYFTVIVINWFRTQKQRQLTRDQNLINEIVTELLRTFVMSPMKTSRGSSPFVS